MRFDRFGVVTNERFRGWRTALLTLIEAGIVSKRQAVEAFGEARGHAAEFYLQQVNAICTIRVRLHGRRELRVRLTAQAI